MLFAALLSLSANLFAADKAIQRDSWYLSQADERATIQLSGYASEDAAIDYLSRVSLPGKVGYYQTLYKNKPWYAVTYGFFNTLDAARAHSKSLPDKLKRNDPWPRTFKAIKGLIRNTAAADKDKDAGKAADTKHKNENIEKNNLVVNSKQKEAQAAYDHGDYAKALKIWQVLAKQGDKVSQFNLGVMYSGGKGVERNSIQAREWYRLSAEQDYAPAQFNIGSFLLARGFTFEDAQKAAIWWQLAAEQEFIAAQFNLASLYCRGVGVSRDMDQCKLWYERAAANGDIHARKILNQIKSREAVLKSDSLPVKESEANSDVIKRTADLKMPGDQPSIHLTSAEEKLLLKKAEAAFTRKNYMKAYKLWLPLANNGLAEAQYSLGFLYQSGWGPERDLLQAVAWYTHAAKQNETRAQFNLGVLLVNGEGNVDKDRDRGIFWLIQSAEANNIRAKEFLISAYSKGEYGIEKSQEKAEYWKSH